LILIIAVASTVVVKNVAFQGPQAPTDLGIHYATSSGQIKPASSPSASPTGLFQSLVSSLKSPKPSTSPSTSASPSPSSSTTSIGIEGIPTSIDISITSGTSVTVANFKSAATNGASGFAMLGYPTGSNNGINWTAQSGGLSPNSSIPQSIQVNSGVTAGVYTGTATIQNSSTKTSTTFPVKVTVTNPAPAPSTSTPAYNPTSSGRYIQITSPNGGEALTVGNTSRITWNSSTLSNVVLNVVDASNIGSTISCANSQPQTDKYCDWVVSIGNTTNTQFKIQATGYYYQPDYSTPTDNSDNYFTINH
jgi:hypothetical protein